jgi:hypothetical protein
MNRLHESVYQDAAHSMAAVGMLAPFVESLFYQAFHGIHCRFYSGNIHPSNDQRWQQSVSDQWDCHFVWNKNRRDRNLVNGIMQLANAVELSRHLPDDLEKVLSALFEYRNKMFHCGFEWSSEDLERFHRRIKQGEWPVEWFSTAKRDEKLWMIFLTDTFIEHCLLTIEKILVGFGNFAGQKNASAPPNTNIC